MLYSKQRHNSLSLSSKPLPHLGLHLQGKQSINSYTLKDSVRNYCEKTVFHLLPSCNYFNLEFSSHSITPQPSMKYLITFYDPTQIFFGVSEDLNKQIEAPWRNSCQEWISPTLSTLMSLTMRLILPILTLLHKAHSRCAE